MPQTNFVHTREIVRSAAEARRECAELARRTPFGMVEIRSSTRRAIIESWKLMAEADAILAKRAVPHAKKPEPLTPARGRYCRDAVRVHVGPASQSTLQEISLENLALYQQILRTAQRLKTLRREIDDISRELYQRLDDFDIIMEKIQGRCFADIGRGR
jgi:hypothetical protein